MKREFGYYWVKWTNLHFEGMHKDDNWTIGFWNGDQWLLYEVSDPLNDNALFEIDERRIERTPQI